MEGDCLEGETELSLIQQQGIDVVQSRLQHETELVLCTAGQAGSAWHQLGDDGEGSTGVHTRSERSNVAIDVCYNDSMFTQYSSQ